jgi:hypothetical protein
MNQKELETWLEAKNFLYDAQEMPAIRRPFTALGDYSLEFKQTVLLRSTLADKMFDWFYARSDAQAHLILPLFTGAFYYGAYFWPLSIPLGYGKFRLEPINCLQTMTEVLKCHVRQDQRELDFYFADCLDYSYGLKSLLQDGMLTPKASSLMSSANAELVGSIAQLIIPRPNTKAILALSMASEIFMKALLVQEKSLTEQELKALGHKIPHIAEACRALVPEKVFQTLAMGEITFPDVSHRYNGKSFKLTEVWEAVRTTQAVAATVIRKYVDHGMRSTVIDFYRESR